MVALGGLALLSGGCSGSSSSATGGDGGGGASSSGGLTETDGGTDAAIGVDGGGGAGEAPELSITEFCPSQLGPLTAIKGSVVGTWNATKVCSAELLDSLRDGNIVTKLGVKGTVSARWVFTDRELTRTVRWQVEEHAEISRPADRTCDAWAAYLDASLEQSANPSFTAHYHDASKPTTCVVKDATTCTCDFHFANRDGETDPSPQGYLLTTYGVQKGKEELTMRAFDGTSFKSEQGVVLTFTRP